MNGTRGRCDDGHTADGGGCSPGCGLAPHCGDGHVDTGYE
jgi:hypothetical protein